MRNWDALPEHQLALLGEVSAQFLALGVNEHRAAARVMSQLQFGRNADRADIRGRDASGLDARMVRARNAGLEGS